MSKYILVYMLPEELVQLNPLIMSHPKTREVIEKFQRIATYDLPSAEAQIVELGVRYGILQFTYHYGVTCASCGRGITYPLLKSGPRKGKENLNRPKPPFGAKVHGGDVSDHVFVCSSCLGELHTLNKAMQYIRQNDLHVELPSDTWYAKEIQRKCFKCGELMWEFDMPYETTILGDGVVHVRCPKCNAPGIGFAGGFHDKTGVWRMVPSKDVQRWRGQWFRGEPRRTTEVKP
jgi:hypothetical protein